MANQLNITLKFKDVKIDEITCEKITMGKGSSNNLPVTLLRYGSDKKTLHIQGPWIKIKQFGVPPGQTLSNGDPNKYYNSEESRLSIRFPIDEKCCCTTTETNTNETEITEFINFLKNLDNHIKKLVTDEEIDKYTPIYRKGIKSKTSTSSNTKFYSMKTKLDTGKYSEGKDKDNKIMTEFHEYNNETSKYEIVNNPANNQISLDRLEKLVKYNSEVLPIFKLVKIWTQQTGSWGVTLKLAKARVKNPVYSEKGCAIFLDEDNEEHMDTSAKVKPPAPPVKLSNKKEDSESDDESDDDLPVTQKASKTKVIESDSDSDSESEEEIINASKTKVIESESEEEPEKKPEPVKQKKITTVVDSDSDEDVKSKKPVKKNIKTKKSNA
jgi:hypothetical protein